MFTPKVQLNAYKFEQLIQRRGRDVSWQQSTLCSCWNMDSEQPVYGCLACGGKGYIYASAIIGRVLLTSITASKQYQEMAGVFEAGDAVMTVPSRVWDTLPNGFFKSTFTLSALFKIGVNDFVTVTDDAVPASDILVKGTPIYGRPADTLLNAGVAAVSLVRKSNPTTGVVTTYTPATDYTVSSNRIAWTVGGNAPALGEQYSVLYTHRPTYTVLLNLPKPRHQDGQDFPRYVALRLRKGGFDPK